MIKTALITGAAVRIGRAIALDLARHGWAVAIHYNTSEDAAAKTVAEIVEAGGQAIPVQGDLADLDRLPGIVGDAIDGLGPLTLLVNNASVFEDDRIGSLTADRWRRQMDINLTAPCLLAQAFAEALPDGLEGNIVNIIDQRVWKPTPQFFSYSLSKSALWSATRTMAQALAPRIRVNAIGPGPTLANQRQRPEDFAALVAAMPLERGASPEEVAETVRFLVGQKSVTGQMIATDGGQHLAWQTPDLAEGME